MGLLAASDREERAKFPMRQRVEQRSPDERFVEFARTRDQDLRQELVADHLTLASRLARRFMHRNETYDDLQQVASLGLLKAVDGFRPELGYEFSAYATRTILGELKRYFRDHGWSVKTPRRLQELYVSIGPVADELAQELGRSPTPRELATRLGVCEEDVLEAIGAGHAYQPASLDAPDDSGDTRGNQLGAADSRLEVVERLSMVEPGISQLPKRERRILYLRFYEDLTQSEIARKVGLSQMQISRLLDRSLKTLRSSSPGESDVHKARRPDLEAALAS